MNRKLPLLHGGPMIVIGSRGDVTIPRDIMSRVASYFSRCAWIITEAEEKEIHARDFSPFWRNGTLRLVTGQEIPLSEAPRAHKEILPAGA